MYDRGDAVFFIFNAVLTGICLIAVLAMSTLIQRLLYAHDTFGTRLVQLSLALAGVLVLIVMVPSLCLSALIIVAPTIRIDSYLPMVLCTASGVVAMALIYGSLTIASRYNSIE